MTLKEIKQILETRQLHPLKRFGQNFLHDQNLCQWIVKEAAIQTNEIIWEIGPGLGALTEWTLSKAKAVELIEIDRGFISYLKEKWIGQNKITLHEGDALELVPHLVPPNVPCVIGNLPYSITTPLLAAFLKKEIPPQRMIFTLQHEVAERLLAQPGNRDYGAISVMVQSVYQIKLLKKLSPSVFYPQPEVFSAVVSFIREKEVKPLEWREQFFSWIRKAFSQKRKQLLKVLNTQFHLGKAGENWATFFEREKWSTKVRAEELSGKQWEELFNYYLLQGGSSNGNNLSDH